MPKEFTHEELLALYHELSTTRWLDGSTATVIAYIRSLLLVPTTEYRSEGFEAVRKLNPSLDDIDCADNIREKIIHRSKYTVEPADGITIRDIFGKGEKMIRVAAFFKKLLYDVPLKRLPLYIEKFPPVNAIVAWRLKIGK